MPRSVRNVKIQDYIFFKKQIFIFIKVIYETIVH